MNKSSPESAAATNEKDIRIADALRPGNRVISANQGKHRRGGPLCQQFS